MADTVKRDWRSRSREVRHTREVRSETIPPQVAEALLQMAEKLNGLTMELIDAKNRLEQVEAVHRVLGEEARKRVA
jgi:hypothetical protein